MLSLVSQPFSYYPPLPGPPVHIFPFGLAKGALGTWHSCSFVLVLRELRARFSTSPVPPGTRHTCKRRALDGELEGKGWVLFGLLPRALHGTLPKWS